MDESLKPIIVCCSIVAMAALLFGNQGFRSWARATLDERHLRQSLAELRSEHGRLSHELALLEHEPSYTEYLIRKNLRYVKKGEVEYRLVGPQKPSQ